MRHLPGHPVAWGEAGRRLIERRCVESLPPGISVARNGRAARHFSGLALRADASTTGRGVGRRYTRRP